MVARPLFVAFLVLVGGAIYVTTQVAGLPHAPIIVVAGVVGVYMALNIGANDVANNVGPAVGSGALPLIGALAIAVVFETAGALIAGGDVVDTISKGIIATDMVSDAASFIRLMPSRVFSRLRDAIATMGFTTP